MFLVVFVTLVISIIGLYAQVLSVQAAKLYSKQNALMQTMVTWHTAAVDMVRNTTPTNISATGCLMTAPPAASLGPNLPTTCTGMLSATGAPAASIQASIGYLPPGYNDSVAATSGYNFYSIAFVNSNVNYVVTFVKPAATSNGFLQLPDSNGVMIGYTIHDLALQFTHVLQPSIAYGWVNTGGYLAGQIPGTGSGGSGVNYVIPSPPYIPVGSLAILSPAQ